MLRNLVSWIILILLCLPYLVSAQARQWDPSKCLITKAAFDVGSGSTKVKVARVDRCRKEILQVLLEDQRPVPYKEDLTTSDRFSPTMIQQGKQALIELKKAAVIKGAKAFEGVATSAFRTAKNGRELVNRWNKDQDLGLNLKVIHQKEEAHLGYVGAYPYAKSSSFVVWDIGGGSMQMLGKYREKIVDYNGQVASVTFKNHIIKNIQNKNPAAVASPNPISKAEMEAAIAWIKATIPDKVHHDLRKLLGAGEVLGIGSVHRFAIGGQLEQKSWTTQDLRKRLQRSIGKSDQKLGGGTYVSTNVSNMILVLGFMEALDIKKVTALKVNLSDGVLLKE